MSSEAHLKILFDSTERWNAWRLENPDQLPNFSQEDLSGLRLRNANLNGAALNDADLAKTDLLEARLIGAKLQDANLSETNLRRACLISADLSRASLTRADLTGASLSGANLDQACGFGADLTSSDLTGASLAFADLTGAVLNRADLTGADLAATQLIGANLYQTNLTASRLQATQFQRALIYGTIFCNVDLSAAKGLGDAQHVGPSPMGVDTLRKSDGQISAAFLRGCGLTEWQIEFSKLHRSELTSNAISDILYRVHELRANQPIQISPLFISYSHDDYSFVDALERRLSGDGIRFWRDIHHATAGPLEKQVDRAMRINDTVLLVLSKSSVNSDWVETEVNLARRLEKDKKKHVLCPVALDDSWTIAGWERRLMDQIKKYNILDFSNWQDDQFFSRQFQKLKDGLQIFY